MEEEVKIIYQQSPKAKKRRKTCCVIFLIIFFLILAGLFYGYWQARTFTFDSIQSIKQAMSSN